MAERHRRGIRLVKAPPEIMPRHARDRPRHLLLAGTARAHHRLLDPQRCILENRQPAHRRRGHRRAPRRAQNLRCLEVLHVDRLLNRHMANRMPVDQILHLVPDRRQALHLRKPRTKPQGQCLQHPHISGPTIVQHRKTTAPEAWIDPQHNPRVRNPRCQFGRSSAASRLAPAGHIIGPKLP